jgi:hypothetical protein
MDLIRRAMCGGIASMLSTVLKSYDLSRAQLVYNMLWTHGFRLLLLVGTLGATARGAAALARHRLRQLEARSPEWVCRIPISSASFASAWKRGPTLRSMSRSRAGRAGSTSRRFRTVRAPLRSLDQGGVREPPPQRASRAAALLGSGSDQFLCRIHPRVLDRGGRTKGLVREQVAARFPGLGFERHKKVSASRYFSDTVAAEAPLAWDRLGGVRTLARLGIVDARKAEAAARADVGQVIRSGNCRVWEMLTLEAWAGAHA